MLVDSTGIKFLGEGEWKCKKHGAEYRRQRRKVHLGIDARTLEIRAIEITDNGTGDALMLPELLSQIPAVIPPRKNAKAWRSTQIGAASRNETLRTCKRFGRRIWKKWSGYLRRSLVV